MTTMKAPTGAIAYGFGENTSKFGLSTHTQALPRTIQYVRKPTNSAGNSGYAAKVSYGVLQTDGSVAYCLLETSIRTVPNMTDADRTACWDALKNATAGTSATIAGELMKTQVLPGPSDIAP